MPPPACGCKPSHPGPFVLTGVPWTEQQLAAHGLDAASWGGRKVVGPDGSPLPLPDVIEGGEFLAGLA